MGNKTSFLSFLSDSLATKEAPNHSSVLALCRAIHVSLSRLCCLPLWISQDDSALLPSLLSNFQKQNLSYQVCVNSVPHFPNQLPLICSLLLNHLGRLFHSSTPGMCLPLVSSHRAQFLFLSNRKQGTIYCTAWHSTQEDRSGI